MSSSPTELLSDDRVRENRLLLQLLAAVGFLWLAFAILLYFYRDNVLTTGPFGDTFGVLNTLFSGLAFAAFIYTVSLQRRELELQRQELKDTRAELRGQREQMEQQNLTFTQQRFEATFFRLLDLHHSIVQAAALPLNPYQQNQRGGRAALADLGDYLRLSANDHSWEGEAPEQLKWAVEFYLRMYHTNQHALAHYFRNLYRVFKLIDDSAMPIRSSTPASRGPSSQTPS